MRVASGYWQGCWGEVRHKEGRVMERHEILEAMSGLKLYGMRASFDEIAGKGLARRHEIYPLMPV